MADVNKHGPFEVKGFFHIYPVWCNLKNRYWHQKATVTPCMTPVQTVARTVEPRDQRDNLRPYEYQKALIYTI